MIHEKVHSLFLFFLLFLLMGCNGPKPRDFSQYIAYKDKADALKEVQLDSAYFYYNLAKESLNDKEDENHTYVLLQMATIQEKRSDLFGSEQTVTEALENPKDILYKPYLYNMLAISYDRQRRYDEALVYYRKAFHAFKDDLAKAVAQNNIGLIYREKKQYQKAIAIFNPLLKNQYLKSQKKETARVLDNLGYTQFKMNSPEAHSNLLESLRLRDSLHDIHGSISSYIHLSEFYIATDKEKSRQYAEEAFHLARKLKSAKDRLESLRWLVMSDQDLSGKYTHEYIRLDDSVDLAGATAKNQFAKLKFDSEKPIKEKARAEQRSRNITVVLVIVTLVLLIVIYLVRYVNKQRYKASVYETETRISKKIHDELANDIFNTLTFAETQQLQDKEKKEAFLEEMEKIYHKARNISNENNEIVTNEGFEPFLKEMIAHYNSDRQRIIVKDNKEIDWDLLDKHKKVTVYRVIQELLVNMKKHSKADFVILGFENHNRYIEINYSDNGVGIEMDKFHKKGLFNVENRIQAVKGTFTFDTRAEKGFRVTIQIPK